MRFCANNGWKVIDDNIKPFLQSLDFKRHPVLLKGFDPVMYAFHYFHDHNKIDTVLDSTDPKKKYLERKAILRNNFTRFDNLMQTAWKRLATKETQKKAWKSDWSKMQLVTVCFYLLLLYLIYLFFF